MKYLIKTTVSKRHTTKVCNEVTKMYKGFGLDVSFDIEEQNINVSHEGLYGRGNVWTILSTKVWWSFKKNLLRIFYRPQYDGLCLFIDGKRAPKKVTKNLRGLHSPDGNGVGLMQLYSYPSWWAKKIKGKKGIYYGRTSKKYGLMLQDTYVLAHEIAHNLDYRIGKNQLHQEILKDNFKGYLKYLSEKLSEKNTKKGLKMKRATSERGQWLLTQRFGVNGVCTRTGRDVFVPVGNTCPSGSKSIYKWLGLKGHNGIDWASPVNWRMYFNVLNQDDPKMTWTCWNARKRTYGNKIVVISDKPIFFKKLPKEVDPKLFKEYETSEGYELYVGIVYLHINKSKVRDGQKIQFGDYFATTGNSGLSTGPHTHEAMKFVDKNGYAIGKDNGYSGAFNHEKFYE